MDPLISTIISTVFISLISLLGGIFLLFKKYSLKSITTYLVSFAAGVMLSSAILDLLPEALEEGGGHEIFYAVLSGIVLFFFLERFLLWFHHHDDTHGIKPTAILVLFGDGLHNVFDGIAIAATYLTNPGIGIVTTLAIAAHEIPQEIADLSILIHTGMSKKKAILLNLLSGLTALVGAVVGYFFLSSIESLLPILIAFTAGMFIYISCSDLIPDLHEDFKKQKGWIMSVPFVFGIVLMVIIIRLLHG